MRYNFLLKFKISKIILNIFDIAFHLGSRDKIQVLNNLPDFFLVMMSYNFFFKWKPHSKVFYKQTAIFRTLQKRITL